MAATTPQPVKTLKTMNISRKMFRTHMPRRITNSVRIFREEIAKHNKTSPESVKIGSELNRYLMMGAINGFYGVKVEVEKTGEIIKVDLAEKKSRIKVTDSAKKDEKQAGGKSTEKPGKETVPKTDSGKPKTVKAPEAKKQDKEPEHSKKTEPAAPEAKS